VGIAVIAHPDPRFSLDGRVAIVTGGYGVLGGCLASGLAAAGARVAILGRREEQAQAKANEIRAAGGDACALVADVLDEAQLTAARDTVLRAWGAGGGGGRGRIDIVVTAAGGNVGRARNDGRPIFEVPHDAFDEVVRVNLQGTVLPALIFGEAMARQRRGSIVTISSMAATRALSGALGYSVAKAGIDAFTRWLAVEMARRYGEGVRVNAIAPGFFLSEQNRHVLVQPDGSPTERARAIIAHTPMGRLGRPEELLGAVQWLTSDASSFVTGVVVPIDGGFSAFGGV
jgi:NAD(P)-dependent dehydrogenase (short-subunit alcohol dehydrogenase family)